jgi:hypothetical protein
MIVLVKAVRLKPAVELQSKIPYDDIPSVHPPFYPPMYFTTEFGGFLVLSNIYSSIAPLSFSATCSGEAAYHQSG